MAGELFEDDLRGRKGQDGKRPQKGKVPARVGELHRNTRGLPEVVIKVSSYTKDRSRAGAHVDYVTRRDKDGGDLPFEMSDGSVLHVADEIDSVLDDWFSAEETRKDARRTVNIVLSSPTGSDRDKVTAAVREFSKDFFGNHEYMFVIHTDTSNPHAHLTVKTRDLDQQQLRLGKKELKEMRDLYAEKLRSRGIEVNSAYRTDRGQWRRAKSQALHHLDKPPRKSKIAAAVETKAATRELSAKSEPWCDSMSKRLIKTKGEYLGAAKYLRSGFDGKLDKQAADLEEFAASLSKPTTKLDEEARRQQEATRQAQQRDNEKGGVER